MNQAQQKYLAMLSSFTPTINELNVDRTVVNPRIPAPQHLRLEAGLPRRQAEPTTTAHSPLLWQRHDVKTVKFACVLSAGFIFASVTLGRKENEENAKQNSPIGWTGGVTWLSTGKVNFLEHYIGNYVYKVLHAKWKPNKG